MTFLAPSLLWFMLLIIIPIIIHLFNRLQLKTTDFSTIRFIKELKKTSIRKVQLKKLLLMFLRIFIITLLVFMISRPVTEGFIPGWLSAEQESTLIVIIDNSATMSRKVNGQSLLKKSKSSAMTLIPIYDRQTNIKIFQTCPPKILFTGSSSNPELRNKLRSIKPTVSYDNIWSELHKLILNNNEDQIKECIVFSDFMYKPNSKFLKGVSNLDDWKFYFIQPESSPDNLGLIDVSTLNRIRTLDQLIKLNVRVKNSGLIEKPSVPLELLFNNQRVGQVISKFRVNNEKEFLFQAYPVEVGLLEASVTLPMDDYEFDNYWYFSMPIMNHINCKIIVSDSNEVQILNNIIKSIDSNGQFIDIETSVQSSLTNLFFHDTDLIIIHNLKVIDQEGAEKIETFINRGGGVIWFQGEKSNSGSFNNHLAKIGFPELSEKINSGEGFFNTEVVATQSNILKDIQVSSLSKELPEIFNYIKVYTNTKHDIHLQIDNGDPILIEFRKGSGTVFFFPTLIDLRWSDFPIRGMLVPLLYQLIILSGTDEVNTAPVLVDEDKWIAIQGGKLKNKWEVLSPSGRKELLVPQYDKERINITKTNELGIYQVFADGEKITSFPTRLHYKEFMNKPIKSDDINDIISQENFRWFTMNNKLATTFSEIRQGKSLWKLFLVIAIVMLLIETIIGRPRLTQSRNAK